MNVKTINTDNAINLDLSVTNKKKFYINGDKNKCLELNTSDMGIVNRLAEVIPRLEALSKNATNMLSDIPDMPEFNDEPDTDTIAKITESAKSLGDKLTKIDKEMRECIDYLFNANVSEQCASDGSMYDLFNGSFRYDIIINALIKHYETTLNAENDRVEKQIKKHTSKFKKG